MTLDDTDERLVQRTLDGDATAYEVLVRRHRRGALARALAIVGDALAADDVAQDALVQAYEQLATLRDRARFGAWLFTIVHRTALNAIRSEQRRRIAPLSDAIPDLSADAATGAGESRATRAALLSALGTLPPVQRTVVLLADLEDWPHERIAAAVGCSVSMSRRHLSDARKQLRALLVRENSR